MVDFDYGIAIRHIAAQSSVTESEIARMIGEVDLMIQYETGLISSESFFETIKKKIDYKGDLEDFRPLFGDIFTEIKPMSIFLNKLKSKGVPTSAFSNTNEMAIEFIRSRFPFYHEFDYQLLSYEKKRMKPDPLFYKDLERETGYSGRQIIYLDDRPENIEQGLAMGWLAHLHTTPDPSIQFVTDNLGIQV